MLPRRFSAHGRRWGVLLMPPHELGLDYISKWVIPWDEHFDPFVPSPVAPSVSVEAAETQEPTHLVYKHKIIGA